MRLPDDLTVVIAAKDEVNTIGDVIVGASRFAKHLVVVDGHSTDGTAAVSRGLGAVVISDNERGKGDAVRAAIPMIPTRIVVFLDADGSHDPADIPRLVAPIIAGAADHVSGSRLIGGSSELHGGFDEFFRLAGASFITACINWRFGVSLSESQNGFRAISTAVLRQLDLRENTTTIEQEMIIKTLVAGYRIAEVACHEYKRVHGSSHIVVCRAAPVYIWSLVRNLSRRRRPLQADSPAYLRVRRTQE